MEPQCMRASWMLQWCCLTPWIAFVLHSVASCSDSHRAIRGWTLGNHEACSSSYNRLMQHLDTDKEAWTQHTSSSTETRRRWWTFLSSHLPQCVLVFIQSPLVNSISSAFHGSFYIFKGQTGGSVISVSIIEHNKQLWCNSVCIKRRDLCRGGPEWQVKSLRVSLQL